MTARVLERSTVRELWLSSIPERAEPGNWVHVGGCAPQIIRGMREQVNGWCIILPVIEFPAEPVVGSAVFCSPSWQVREAPQTPPSFIDEAAALDHLRQPLFAGGRSMEDLRAEALGERGVPPEKVRAAHEALERDLQRQKDGHSRAAEAWARAEAAERTLARYPGFALGDLEAERDRLGEEYVRIGREATQAEKAKEAARVPMDALYEAIRWLKDGRPR